MNDPHVEKLYYRFKSEDPNVLFVNAQLLTVSFDSFDVEIKEDQLTAIPLEHYTDEASARASFEPLLRSWESSAFLSAARLRIRFTFEQADIVDRQPTPGNITISLRSISSTVSFGTPTFTVSRNSYPEPDKNFAASALTDELITRLQLYRDGKQTLPHVAYYILEKLEEELVGSKPNKRKVLGKILSIHYDVLKNIGDISNKSDANIGRHASQLNIPLTSKELNWLEVAIFRLVKRVGEINNGSNRLPLIQMTDLPDL
jgi:hypothetical protein